MRSIKTAVMVCALVGAVSASAQAAPIVGSFSKGGAFFPVDGVTGLPTSLISSTGIDFATFGVASPGVAGTFVVTDSTDDFALLAPVFTLGTVKDFSFTGAGSAAFPLAPITTFETIGGLSVDLLTVSFGPSGLTATTIDLVGTVMFRAAGFTDTPGTFILSGNTTNGVTFGFASTQSAGVPEPASLVLLGLSLLGGAGAYRRRNKLAVR